MSMHPDTHGLLPPAAPDLVTGVGLMVIHDEDQNSITNRPARSTYPNRKSVLTSGATPTFGENVGSLTYEAFGLTAESTDFHETLDGLTNRHSTVEEIDKLFSPALSGQARAYVMTRLVGKSKSS